MVTCKSCGAESADAHRYCHSCGASLLEQPVDHKLIQSMIEETLEQGTSKIIREQVGQAVDEARGRVTSGISELVDNARDRIMNWLKMLLIPAAIVVAIGGVILGAVGFNSLSNVYEKLTQTQEDIQGASTRAQQAIATFEQVAAAMPAKTAEIENTLNNLLAQYRILNVAATRPLLGEIAFTTIFFDIFLKYITANYNNQRLTRLSISVVPPDEFQKLIGPVQTFAVMALDNDNVIISQESILSPKKALENLCEQLLNVIANASNLSEPIRDVLINDPTNAVVRTAIPRYIVAEFLNTPANAQDDEPSIPRNPMGATPGPVDIEVYRRTQEQKRKVDNVVSAFKTIEATSGVGRSLATAIILRAWEKAHQNQRDERQKWSEVFFSALLSEAKNALEDKEKKAEPQDIIPKWRTVLVQRGLILENELSR